MTASFDRFVRHLRSAGVDFGVAADLARDPDHDGSLISAGPRPRRFDELAPLPILEHDDREAGLGSDHASLAVAREIHRIGHQLAGKRVLELGCGTGLLAIQAARFGARVIGTDLDERALELARRNAEVNALESPIEHEIEWRFGSLCEPLDAGDRFDLIVANLPHKPAAERGLLPLSQDGGPEGDALFGAIGDDLARRLEPGGRLIFFLHSLPHPRLLGDLGRHFRLELRRWKLRFLLPGEYGDLVEHFRSRSSEGRSFLHTDGEREALVACVWEAVKKDDAV